MKYEITTPRAAPLVDVEEMKRHLVVDHYDDDELIAVYIEQASDYCQSYTGVTFGEQTYTVYADNWCGISEIALYPIQSVVINYDDPDGVEQLWPADQYIVDTKVFPAKVYLAADVTLPELDAAPNVVRATVVVGDTAIPSQVQAAIYLMVGHLYKEREATSSMNLAEMPFGVAAFLDQYRVF